LRRRREMDFASVALSLSLSLSLSLVEGRHVSSAMRHGICVSRSLNLVVMCRRRRDRESVSLARSLSLSLSLSLSSTRDGWVCSCALVDGRRRDTESASLALSSSCVVGDETWNPRVRSLRGAYTKIPSLLHSSSVIFAR
jgi:hypothetical protein